MEISIICFSRAPTYHCTLGNFSCFFFLSSADFFFKINFLKKKNLSEIPSVCQTNWNLIVGPDLGPNCLPMLSADDTGRQRVNRLNYSHFLFCISTVRMT